MLTNKSDKLIPFQLISRIAIIIITIQVSLFIFSVPGYKVGIDEAWFGEQAYYMSADGYVHSELFDGFGDYGQQLFVYHKLFIWIGSLFTGLFGFSLNVLRSVSIISALGLFGLMGLYIRKQLNSNYITTMLAGMILLSCPLFFSRINNFRPELLLVLFGFSSFLLLTKYLNTTNRWWLVSAGIVGGAGMLVHLNGIIYVSAGVILLLSRKRPVDTILFGIIASIVALLYFADSNGQVGIVLQQFAQEPSQPSANFGWYQPIINLLQEHKRLFRSPEIIGIVLLFIMTLIRGFSKDLKHQRDLVLYTLCLVIIMGLSGHNKTTKYAILLFPFFVLVITTVIWELISKLRSLRRFDYWIIGWLGIYLLLGMVLNIKTTIENKEYITDRTAAVTKSLPSKIKIMAPMKLIFNQIDHFDIRGFAGTNMVLNQKGINFTPSNIHQYALDQKISHLLVDLDFCFDKTNDIELLPSELFETIDTTAGFLILKVIP